jgi:hypothetical protein
MVYLICVEGLNRVRKVKFGSLSCVDEDLIGETPQITNATDVRLIAIPLGSDGSNANEKQKIHIVSQ